MTAAPLAAQGRVTRTVHERWVLAVLVLAVVAVVFGNGWGRFFSDAQPDLYLAPTRVLRNALSAWLPSPYAGAPNYQSGLVPAAAVSAGLSWLGVAPWVIMRVIRVALLVLAGAGARALYRDMLDNDSTWGRTAAAVLFVANPYVVVTAASLAVMQPLAALPWLLLFASRALRGRRTGWNVALVALVFFVMGGENAGVVPVMLLVTAVPALVVDALLVRQVPLKALVLRGLACLGMVVAVSAYWILPSLSAVGAGSAVAAGTETPAIIYATSSFAEVLRGLGGWPLYGADGNGPFEPEFVLYLGQALVVLASFTLCVLGLAGAVTGPRRRIVPLVMVLSGVVVSAGAFPFAAPTLYGRLWLWAQVHVPGMIAFRTGIKAGGLVVLGLSLLGGLAVQRFAQRDRTADPSRTGHPVGRAAVVGVVAAGLVVAVLPVVNGHLFDRSFVIPQYWYEAAAQLDRGDQAARVLVLPGQKLFSYRWRRPSADDPLAGLTQRRLAMPTTAATSTAPAVNFFAALDQPLERGTQRPAAVSAMARYLAADQVVLRSDVVWETSDAARPATMLRQLTADPGLAPDGAYGAPGLNTTGSTPVPPATDIATERSLPPVQVYRVQDPAPLVRTVPATGALLVVGDNAAVPSLVDLGMLEGTRPYLLAGALSADQTTEALGATSAVVLTDSNQRRVVNTSRLANGYGPILPADSASGPTNALFGANDQSVLQLSGADSVTATSSGSIFGPVPFGGPALAFDGDPSTGWTAGDFGHSIGQALTVQYGQPKVVTQVRVVAMRSAPVALGSVDVTVGGVSHAVRIGADGTGLLTIGPTPSRSVTATITRTVGHGDNAVGIAELQVAGADVVPYVRLPLTLEKLAATPAGRERLASMPLTILVQRDRGLNLEGRVLRTFELPDSRDFSLQVDAAASRSLSDTVVDRLVGTSGEVTSSGRLFGDLRLRGSQAFDPDDSTSWVGVGSSPWVEATFPARRLTTVTLRPALGTTDGVRLDAPRSARLTFSDGSSVLARLGPGVSTTVRFPQRSTTSLRVTLEPGPGAVAAGLASVTVGSGPRLTRNDTLPESQRCVDLVTVDGVGVPLRTTQSASDVLSGAVGRLQGCAPSQVLGAGWHTLTTGADWLVDRVVLTSAGTAASTAATAPASVTVTGAGATSYSLSVGPSAAGSMLVVGEPYDARWQATMAGRSLGPPLLVDGYALGWSVPSGSGGEVTVSYGPQRVLGAGVAITSAAVLGALVLLLRRRRAPPVGSGEEVPSPSAVRLRPWSRRRLVVVLSASALVVLALGGPAVLLVAMVGALATLPWVAGWTSRVTVAGLVLVALTPIAYLLGNLGRLGSVTPDLVARNLLPNVLTGSGLALVAVAVVVERLHSRPGGVATETVPSRADAAVVSSSATVGGEP